MVIKTPVDASTPPDKESISPNSKGELQVARKMKYFLGVDAVGGSTTYGGTIASVTVDLTNIDEIVVEASAYTETDFSNKAGFDITVGGTVKESFNDYGMDHGGEYNLARTGLSPRHKISVSSLSGEVTIELVAKVENDPAGAHYMEVNGVWKPQ